jgi:LacI family transcriptional regulator
VSESLKSAARPLTIKEIAREAHVSTQTVSRVLNNRPDVSRQTRERVQQVIDQLGYEPSAVARSLIRQRTFTLGFILAQFGYFGPQITLNEVERCARDLGFMLLPQFIHDHEADDGRHQLKKLLSQQVDGILWSVPNTGTNLAWLRNIVDSLHIPIVSIGSMAPGIVAPALIDERYGARLAVQHLVDHGYRRIGLITGQVWWTEGDTRLQGWQDALIAADLPCDIRQIVDGDWSAESGAKALSRLLEQYPELDAVFVANDQMALGALQVLHRREKRVPDEIAVVGFDDFPESAYFWPPLTTVRQPWHERALITVRELNRMIAQKQDGQSITPPQTIMLLPELVVRESSTKKTR